MTVRDILKLVCEFVGERELAQKLATSQQLQEREQQKIEIMTNCFNLVNQEIASDYLPFLHKEEVDIEDGVLNFSSLKNKVINIYEIKNRFGFNLKFRNYSNFVEVFGKGKWVTYSFFPADKALDDCRNEADGISKNNCQSKAHKPAENRAYCDANEKFHSVKCVEDKLVALTLESKQGVYQNS